MSSRKSLNRQYISDGSLERHHIIPRSLGGSNNKDNLIYLTTKEHFLAHLLLTKIHIGKNKAKMVYAFSKMCQCNPNQKRSINSRYYALCKKLMSLYCSGENNTWLGKTHTEETKQKLSIRKIGSNNPMFGKIPWNKGKPGRKLTDREKEIVSKTHKGKIMSEETKKKMSESAKGKPKSEEHRKKLSEVNKGKIISEEHRKKIRDALCGKKQKSFTCPHCGKNGRGSSMLRWHFDKCREKPSYPSQFECYKVFFCFKI